MKRMYIEYEDDYEAVVVKEGDTKKVFATGDAEKDWLDAVLYAGRFAMMSSSCTHFVFDVDGYYFDENDMLHKGDPE